MKLYLIRHFATPGNLKKRYIGGRTDESILRLKDEDSAGVSVRADAYPFVDRLFVSPMKRCQETAAILYPGQNQEIIENFRECDFGIFENKNYQELSGNPAYQSWIDSGGKAAFPGGEAPTEFCRRSREAFERCVKLLSAEGVSSAAFVVHGGTIMSILETYGEPKQDFYAWHVENGCGYCMTVHPDKNGTIRCSELCRIENSR